MTKEQMEEAVSEARELLALSEQGALLPDLEPEERSGNEVVLRRILRNREAWLRGEIILASGVAENPDSEIGRAVKDNVRSVKEGAEMLTKPEAIEYLREMHLLNHEPLRKVEQEWLDRIFIRERMSKGWIGLASVMADAEETGVHAEHGFGPAPCWCEDSVRRKQD